MSMEEFMQIMHQLVKDCEIKIKTNELNVIKPWWNNECSKALAQNFQATKNYQRLGNQENYELMIKNQSKLKKTCRKAKKEEWLNIVHQ